ncbi:MAG TPA: WD40 repeat domain-containing protein, partial [Candidatus Eisenbacteria bacterium]
TAGAEGNVTIHDAKTLAQDSTFPAHARRVYSMAWSLDATRLATGSIDRTARVWQVPDGRLVTTFSEHHGTVAALAFDPSGGRILSTGSDNRLFLWNAATGAILSSFRGHESDVSAIAAGAGPDVVLTGDWGGVIRRWTWRTEDVRTLGYPHTQFEISALNQAAVDPLEEHIACATSVRDAPVWSFDAPLPERLIPLEAGRCMAYTPDGAFLIAGTDKGSVRLIRAADGTTLRSIGAHDGPVFGMALNPSGDLVATTSGDSLIRFWTVPALKPADSIAAGINLRGLAFSPSGDLLAGAGTDGAVRLWSTLPTRLVERIASPSPRLTALAFDSSGQRFAAAGSDGALYLIDPATKRVTLIREAGPAPLTSVAWSRDGTRIAAGALDETVRLFDPEKRREVLSLHGHAGKVTSVLFLRNDRALISTSTDGTVRIWEAGVTGRRGNASETAGLQ